MIRGGEIAKGTCLLVKNAPYLVVERDFVSPGKGSAFARVKMKSLVDGSVITQTIKTADEVEDAIVDQKDCQYQYTDDDGYHFMDVANYEQFTVAKEGNEDKALYLLDGEVYNIIFWEGDPIDVKIPYKMVFEVVESENYVKGDTVSGATKPIKVQTGLTVRVPLFIKQGEKIRINTETNDYLERVNS
jgi:elongation factor P